jgi:hypothetical protein
MEPLSFPDPRDQLQRPEQNRHPGCGHVRDQEQLAPSGCLAHHHPDATHHERRHQHRHRYHGDEREAPH